MLDDAPAQQRAEIRQRLLKLLGPGAGDFVRICG
jgi:hypothetical protein